MAERWKPNGGEEYFYVNLQQEIMSAIPYCRIYKKKRGNFVAVHEKIRVHDSNGATAALKLWLELNKDGVKNGAADVNSLHQKTAMERASKY